MMCAVMAREGPPTFGLGVESSRGPESGDFWLPSLRQVWRQVLVAPPCLVVVEGARIRVTNRRGRVLLDAPIGALTVHRSTLGTLELKCAETGQQVRLCAGSSKNGSRSRALLDQVPREIVLLRFDDQAARVDPFLDPVGTVGAIGGQLTITKRLAASLFARGAHEV